MKKKILRALMSRYKRFKQQRSNLSEEHALRVAKRMLQKSRFVLLVTNAEEASPSARLVQPVLEETEKFYTIWVGTHPDSKKISEIKQNDCVTLVVHDDKHSAQLVLKGRASIESDDFLRRKHWLGVWRMFFPDGPVSPDYVLLQFVPDEMEILSFANSILPEPFGLKALHLKL